MLLCRGPGRSRKGFDVVCGPCTANGINGATVDGRISTAIAERCVLHDRAVDTPTLSPECQQPSHQSVNNPLTRVSTTLQSQSQTVFSDRPIANPRTPSFWWIAVELEGC